MAPKYSNLALKYEVMVPSISTKVKVPKISNDVFFVYSIKALLFKKLKSKLPSIKKYIISDNIGSAILSPIIGAK